jgi:hypothetical protein
MRLCIIGFTCLALSAGTLADGHDQSNNGPGAFKAPNRDAEFPTCYYTGEVRFITPDDVYLCHIAKTEDTAAGILRVRTQDCCIPGDHWQADIVADRPRWKTDIGIGDGNIDTFTGDAFVGPFNAGTVEFSFVEGVDVFSAGMFVEICYSRERDDGFEELDIYCDWVGD